MSSRDESIARHVAQLKKASVFFLILAWLVWAEFALGVGLGLTVLSDYVPHWTVFLVFFFAYAFPERLSVFRELDTQGARFYFRRIATRGLGGRRAHPGPARLHALEAEDQSDRTFRARWNFANQSVQSQDQQGPSDSNFRHWTLCVEN